MKQLNLIKPSKKEHGGIHSLGRRRSRRPITTKEPLHITLHSDFAKGSRSLLRHRPLINHVIQKASKRFGIRVYQRAICGNHIHLLIRGRCRTDIQNFFRVVAGHIAQGILQEFPLLESEHTCVVSAVGGAHRDAPDTRRGGAPHAREVHKDANKKTEKTKGCVKNQRKFWALLIYSRVVTWGREYKTVMNYIHKNILEALNLIAYTPRKKRGGVRGSKIKIKAGGALKFEKGGAPQRIREAPKSISKTSNTS
jgi:REP element-mobilizing transposase RayT